MAKMLKGILFAGLLLLSGSLSFALETASVEKVTDGDTIIVSVNGARLRVRLIGIDTPESSDNAKARRDSSKYRQNLNALVAMGKKASEFAKTLVRKGDTVSLEYDVERTDKYNRTLAYVFLSDGRMLNGEMLRAGYAMLLTIPPNVKYADRFVLALRQARAARVGLWGNPAISMPEELSSVGRKKPRRK